MSDNGPSALTPLESPKIVDLFAGPGGLDVAAHWLGVDSVGIELDSDAINTRLAANLPTKAGDVRKSVPEDFADCNILAGGPPCQTFTVAGNGAGRKALARILNLIEMLGKGQFETVDRLTDDFDDERIGLVLQPLIWALKSSPKYEAVILEQVPAVLPVWEAMAAVLRDHGYATDTGILRTEEFGVPQTRRRAVLVARQGVRQGELKLPEGTHQRFGRGIAPTQKPRWLTMRDALPMLGDFEVISNYGTGGNPKDRGKRSADTPAFTVTGKVSRNRVLTADGQDRRFTPEQAGRLQTFPGDYPWSGRDTSQQIGNAVPPVLGVHIIAAALGIEEERREAAISMQHRNWSDVRPSCQPESYEEKIVIAY